MPLGLGLGISKLKSLISGLRVRFQGNATITAALDGILRELSADFVSNGTVTAALEAIKLLDVDFSGDGIVTADLASFEGLLDLYPNAAAAYSVRLLKSDYTGALVRIRRSSDNAEKDFYPDSNNELSLSSEDGASTSLSSWIGANNGFVVTWYDQSGNTNDSTQSTAANQPQIINAGILITDNSKAAISYTTGSQELTLSLAMTTTHSVFTVNHFNARGKEIIGASGRYLIYQDASVTYYRIDTTFRDFGATITNNQQLLYIDRKNTNVSLFENGAQIGTTVAAANSNTITSLSGEGAGYNFTGKMQEIIIYTSDKSSDKGGIESNINNFYSIY